MIQYDLQYTNNLENIKLVVTQGYDLEKNYSVIAEELNNLGYTTKTGKPFNVFSASSFARKDLHLKNRCNRSKKDVENIKTYSSFDILNLDIKIKNKDDSYVSLGEPEQNVINKSYVDNLFEEKQSNEIFTEDLIHFIPNLLEQETTINTFVNYVNEPFYTKQIKTPFLEYDNFELKYIDFYNSNLLCLKSKITEDEYFSPSKICFALDVCWSSQLQRIKRDDDLAESIVKVNIPSKDDKNFQDTIVLPLKKLSVFLYGIKANMCKNPDVIPKLKTFKNDMENILLNAFKKQDKPLSTLEIIREMLDKMIDIENTSIKALNAVNNINLNVKKLEEQQTKTQISLETIIKEKEEATKQLKELPKSNINLVSINTRKTISRQIGKYLHSKGILNKTSTQDEINDAFSLAWGELKKNFKYVTLNDGTSHNFELLAINKTKKNHEKGIFKEIKFLDVVEEMGYIDDLYSFAQNHIFKIVEKQSSFLDSLN